MYRVVDQPQVDVKKSRLAQSKAKEGKSQGFSESPGVRSSRTQCEPNPTGDIMNDLLHVLTIAGLTVRPLWLWVRGSRSLRHTHDKPAEERSELFSEIRRITSILEIGRRDMWRS